jgi:lactate permease
MPLTFLNWILAFSPVLAVLVLMMGLRWGGSKAGAAAWFAAVIVAVLRFGAGPALIGYANAKAVLLTLDVLYIIWAALLLFHVADEAGAVSIIGERMPGLTGDRTLQALLLSWVFVSFLQGMGGFGVPVAVVAPLLVGLGFTPIQGVVMASLGHGWAVSFGSLATSFNALMAATGIDGYALAPESAILLGVAGTVSGGLVAYAATGWRGVLRGLPAILVIGPVMGVVQYLLATKGLWTLGATGAALAGSVVGVGLTRLPFYRPNLTSSDALGGVSLPSPELERGNGESVEPRAEVKTRSLWISLSAYAVLIALAFAINLIPALDKAFNAVTLTLHFPALTTAFGWETPAEAGRALSPFGHPGAILSYTALIAYAIYARAGYYEPGAGKRIARKVVRGAVGSSLGIASMVGMATVMGHAGMTNIIARGLSESVGPTLYPAVSPFIGALGAFMTGSNTNSNVVFGALQRDTAALLGLSVTLILAGQTAGGALGSVLAPAKVIVGCSTVGLSGEEGPVIGRMLILGMIPVALVALMVWVMAGM